MNLVLGQVEEAIHIVDVSEDGQPSPPRVSHSRFDRHTSELMLML